MNNDRLFKLAIFFMMIIVCHFLRLDQGDHLALGQQDHLKTKNQEMDAFRKAQLDKHNSLRKKHHVGALKLDDKLNQYAQVYAQKLASLGSLVHSEGEYGQNLYMLFGRSSKDYLNGAATQSWYDEIKVYNWKQPGFSMKTGHFTQVVWKGSKKVGFGFASNAKGQVVIVAEYDPPGNYERQYEKNVLKV